MRSTIYISWKVQASISNTEKTKYSHLDLDINDYVATMILRDSEAEDKEYEHGKKRTEKSIWYSVKETGRSSITAWKKKNTKAHREEEKNVHKVSHKCIYSYFKFQ